jgi:hypothetical protein
VSNTAQGGDEKECKNARMQKCKNAKMQECKNARMQKCKNVSDGRLYDDA